MSEKWMPKYGEVYYYISESLVAEVDCNEHTFTDKERIGCANCFRTEAEAEAAAEKVKALLLSLHSEPVADCNQLPKLTAEVFDRPDCPSEATFAIVYQDGSASYMKGDPVKMKSKEKHWIYTLSSGIENLGEIPGRFDPSDWKNSLVERPAKALPDWCKIGNWFWHPEDMAGGRYLKITEIRGGGVYAKEKEDYDPDYLCFDLVRKYSKRARLRPYDGDEIPDLPFEVTERNSNFRTTVVSCQGNNVLLGGASTAISTEELMRDFTAKGEPCGVLEHLENGEWVK